MEIDLNTARKVLEIVDAGLVKGAGNPVPGECCVEAAVCLALGLPHGDEPVCVASALRSFKIRLNDSNWSSNMARAAGLRRLALVQLGSAGALDENEFRARIVKWAVTKCVPFALRAAASIQKSTSHKAALLDHAARCEREGTRESALAAKEAAAAAYAADAYAAYARAKTRDEVLAGFAEDVVRILIEMQVPGVQWLVIAPLPSKGD